MTKSLTTAQITDRKPTESRPSGLRLHWLDESSDFIRRTKQKVKQQKLPCTFMPTRAAQIPVHIQSNSKAEVEPAEAPKAACSK